MKTDEAYIKLAERNGKADSKAMLRILQCAMTPEEARFLLELPASNADLAAKFNMDEKAVEKKIQGLAQRGLVTASRKGYRYPRDPGTLHDNILASAPQYIPPGIDKLWMELYEGEEWWREIAQNLGSMGNQILRTIPVLKSTPPGIKLLPYESIKDIIQAHKNLITVRHCCCRVGAKKCAHPTETCTQFGRRAEYDLYRSSGKKISADEAIAISMKAAEAGLVPTVTNISAMEALEFICYCDRCACLVLNPTLRAGNVHQVLAPSRFLAKVDNEKCNGCEECVPWCFFDAIAIKEVPGLDTPKAVINAENCVGCGLCVLKCGPEAITMELVRPPEFIPETIAGPSSIVH
jgi:Pyruvate/2-oxoacid:ferredoxin oxidoreductase delta subunit/biotin operon repressor